MRRHSLIALVLTILTSMLSSPSLAGTAGDAQGEYLAAQNASVQKLGKLIASTNFEVSNEQCDFTPGNATFPKRINSQGDLVVRFNCKTNSGYNAYIDVAGTLSSDGVSVAIAAAKFVHTGKKN